MKPSSAKAKGRALHKHHLVPKHRGGTDADGLVEVSVIRHAMFHYAEWRLHGLWEDKAAWQLLVQNVKHPLQVEGREVSQETRQKLSKSLKGNKNAAQPCSEETKRKISEAQKGRTISENQKKQISEYRKGQKHSEETKAKCREAGKKGGRKKGCVPWNKGLTNK